MWQRLEGSGGQELACLGLHTRIIPWTYKPILTGEEQAVTGNICPVELLPEGLNAMTLA